MEFPANRPDLPDILVEEDLGSEDTPRELQFFSRGIMTQSLMRLGLPPERALELVLSIKSELQERGIKRIPHSRLRRMILERLEDLEPEEARYPDRFRYLEEQGGALVVLIGGTTGSGKTTVAVKVAHRLGIEHVVGTDSLREALRSAISPGIAPALHESSYTAWQTLAKFAGDGPEVQRMGFLEHARPVATGINGLLRRARAEDVRIVIEGVHVVPSLLEDTFREAPNVMMAVVNVPDEEEHRERFQSRSYEKSLRKSAAEYLKHFPAIREIHDFIAEDAQKHGFPVIDSRDPERAAALIIERLWRRILAADL
ncbi:hypothetical protein E0L93_10635 [Rubrobacter taiwanensis]|jgi:2-phosphoglycerate kinase|uniref:2-phosphoglycerate kinase n=1 Tax=Rubrobacter taiwanensis TaxID=185139 RepID=A0A4R1BG60_9ACTN|nr:AAA family ATPase [Rubrobacter taiwanensis]TCJ16127.1 hypothetical protein E0L93_10635 [Rubrobacter taiwanensis]